MKAELEKANMRELADKKAKKFSVDIIRQNAPACSDISSENFDIQKARTESQNSIQSLEPKGGLQEMLAAQIISLHRLQQTSMALAVSTHTIANKQYFTNAAVKLANCFTQQASLLAKLQGNGNQKIVVEHVEVHQGGQAVVGNISGGSQGHKEKK